jgi:hypothetical protein
MFTLSVHKDYPLTREIILLNTYGVDSVDMDDVSVACYFSFNLAFNEA